MPQNKEHWSLRLLHGLLLEMTNGLSCLLNFPRSSFAFALGPLRCESLPLQAVLLGPRTGWRTRTSIVRQQWPATVRECLASAHVPRTRCSKPQWTSVHERFKQRIGPSEAPLKMSCSGTQTRQGGWGGQCRCICRVHLLTLCCVRNISPCTRNTHTHIKLDRWMKRLYYRPWQFSSNYTWQWDTYSAVSRDNPLPSNRGGAKDMALCVCSRQPLLSDFDRCHPWQLIVLLPCRKCLLTMVPKQITDNHL